MIFGLQLIFWAIAANIPQRLKTGFVVQSHISQNVTIYVKIIIKLLFGILLVHNAHFSIVSLKCVLMLQLVWIV